MGAVVPIGEARSRRAAGAPLAVDPADVARRLAAGQRLLTPAELSKRIRVSERQIRRDRLAGMPSVPITATRNGYILADVLAWQRARREAGGNHTEGSAA